MKICITILFIAFSIGASANCADDFNKGLTEYNFAANYFDSGLNSYNTAVELSRSQDPNFLIICNHLVDSVSGFSVATDSYGNCAEAFGSAATSCRGSSSSQASENQGVCEGNETVAHDNLNVVRRTLKNTCFKGSQTLEVFELENSERLVEGFDE